MCAPCSGEPADEFYESIGRTKDDICPRCGHMWGKSSPFCLMCGRERNAK